MLRTRRRPFAALLHLLYSVNGAVFPSTETTVWKRHGSDPVWQVSADICTCCFATSSKRIPSFTDSNFDCLPLFACVSIISRHRPRIVLRGLRPSNDVCRRPQLYWKIRVKDSPISHSGLPREICQCLKRWYETDAVVRIELNSGVDWSATLAEEINTTRETWVLGTKSRFSLSDVRKGFFQHSSGCQIFAPITKSLYVRSWSAKVNKWKNRVAVDGRCSLEAEADTYRKHFMTGITMFTPRTSGLATQKTDIPWFAFQLIVGCRGSFGDFPDNFLVLGVSVLHGPKFWTAPPGTAKVLPEPRSETGTATEPHRR